MFHIFYWISFCGFHIPFLLDSTRSCVKSSEVSPRHKANSFSQVAGWKLLRSSMGGAHLFKPQFFKKNVSWFMSVLFFRNTWFGMVWQSLGPFSKALWSFCANAFGDRLAIGGFVSVSVVSVSVSDFSDMSHGAMWGEGKWHHWRSQGRKIQKKQHRFLVFLFFFVFFRFCVCCSWIWGFLPYNISTQMPDFLLSNVRPVWRAWKALRWNANGWCVTARRCPINGAWRWRCGIRFFFDGYW